MSLEKPTEWNGDRQQAFEADLQDSFEVNRWLGKDESRYFSILQNLSEIVWILDPETTVLFETPSGPRTLGYSPGEMIGKVGLNFIHPDDVPEAKAQFALVLSRSNDSLPTTLRLRRADGGWLPMEIVGVNLLEHPSVRGILITARDITRRQAAEGALEESEKQHRYLLEQMQHTQKLESLGVLAGGIAHDFNNLLMSILGHTDLVLTGCSLNPAGRESLTAIKTAASRAASLCRQLLAYSGKGRFETRRLKLTDVVWEMTNLLEVSISKKASLELQLESDIPYIEADSSQVRQVVMNLITNASEALSEQGGVINISVRKVQCSLEDLRKNYLAEDIPAGTYVMLEVKDTGTGMDQETVSKLFDPFFSTKFTGRGLGLSAVLGILRSHSGAIQVESEPGRGSIFRALFPAEESKANPAAFETPAHGSTALHWLGSGTILLVDDEGPVRMVAQRMLERLGFGVLLAENGRIAVDLFQQQSGKICCVMLDLTMPEMDGEECFRELRRLQPDIKVIISSGYDEQDIVQRFTGQGLAGFIQKPYTLDNLIHALHEVLS